VPCGLRLGPGCRARSAARGGGGWGGGARRGGAGVHAALRLRLRHALHAVHAALVLELTVHGFAAHLRAGAPG